jgi:hypothetical protein
MPSLEGELRSVLEALETVTDALDDSNIRMEAVANKVDRWITQGLDESLSEAARTTYLECAEDIIACMKDEEGELCPSAHRKRDQTHNSL